MPFGKQKKHLHIDVIDGKNLRKSDTASASDPYVSMKVKGLHRPRKTTVKKNTSNPRWNEGINLHVQGPSDILKVKVYDKDIPMKNKLLGTIDVPLTKYLTSPGQSYTETFPLRKKKFFGKFGKYTGSMGELRLQIGA